MFEDKEKIKPEGLFNTKNIAIIRGACETLRALNNRHRSRILNMLHVFQETTVTELYVSLRMEQSVVSLHLGILRRAGLVKCKREGKHIYYSVNTDTFDHVIAISNLLLNRKKDERHK